MASLKQIVNNAVTKQALTKESAEVLIALADEFNEDIAKKSYAMIVLKGEVLQLKSNEQKIIELVNKIIAAKQTRTMKKVQKGQIRKGVVVVKKLDVESTDEAI